MSVETIYTEAVVTPDQRSRRKKKKSTPSKQSSKQAKVPERLFHFEVAPPPAAPAPSTSASAPSPPSPPAELKQQPGTAPAWPFPLVLPGCLSTANLAPSVTTHESQGLGYEYGPEVYIDRADYWEDATTSSPSFTPKPLAKRKDSHKKSKKKSKLCPTNGYQGLQLKAGDKRVQVKYSSQWKQWTASTKEFLSEGGVRRIQVTYHMTVEVEEEHPVDKDGNIVTDADKDTDLNVRPRVGETNIDMDWSSEDETDDSSDSSDSSDSDDADEQEENKKKSVGRKGRKHKVQCPKHPGYAALHKKEKAVASSESSTTKKKEEGDT
ncbi:MAG: hypothetical protein HETSPECPRED_002711 [Heterodermia speciosa]|uniref:Uncharacterized protein n=1 Tax=Heterodermia speciosa TaxID=116794 RepID=A0A8H3F0I4_9LECA|nr:MAG: hypothetical protein HETSPECPRED_002711 [Heterodermia speciosa]